MDRDSVLAKVQHLVHPSLKYYCLTIESQRGKTENLTVSLTTKIASQIENLKENFASQKETIVSLQIGYLKRQKIGSRIESQSSQIRPRH